MQQNSRLGGDRDEMINDIISECSKLAHRKYKTKQNWVSKVIHWDFVRTLNLTIPINGIRITQNSS